MINEEKDNIISALIATIGNAPLKEKSKLIVKYAEMLRNIDFICVDEINGHDNFNHLLINLKLTLMKFIVRFIRTKSKF